MNKNKRNCLCPDCIKKEPFSFSKEDLKESVELVEQNNLICWGCGFDG